MGRNSDVKMPVTPIMTLRDLCKRVGVIDTSVPLVYSDLEMLQLLYLRIVGVDKRLEKAKQVYREQEAKIAALSDKQLWTFGKFLESPPDYKAEYMRRIKGGQGVADIKVFKGRGEH